MAAVKAEIQAIETAWAAATNARDVNALMALYADDAVKYGKQFSLTGRKSSHTKGSGRKYEKKT